MEQENKEYIEIKTLSELEKYKNRVLLFGYENIECPNFAWAAKFLVAESFDEKNDPSAPIEELNIKTFYRYVEMYQGAVDENSGLPILDPEKVECGENDSWFDCMFVRTLTKVEQQAYRKAMKHNNNNLYRL